MIPCWPVAVKKRSCTPEISSWQAPGVGGGGWPQPLASLQGHGVAPFGPTSLVGVI